MLARWKKERNQRARERERVRGRERERERETERERERARVYVPYASLPALLPRQFHARVIFGEVLTSSVVRVDIGSKSTVQLLRGAVVWLPLAENPGQQQKEQLRNTAEQFRWSSMPLPPTSLL